MVVAASFCSMRLKVLIIYKNTLTKSQIRELLIFALVKETTPSKQALQLLSASLQEATQVTSEVSYEAQVDSS